MRTLFAEKFDRVHLVLAPLHGEEQVDLVRRGELDGGLTPLPVAAETIAVQSLGLEPLMVVIRESHPLGKAKVLRLRDLKGVPMIAVTKKLCPQLHGRIHDAFAREGFQPAVSDEVMTPADAIAMIASRDGFAFVHQCDVEFRCPGVVFRAIQREPVALESGIVYRPDGASPIIHALIAAFQPFPRVFTSTVALPLRAL